MIYLIDIYYTKRKLKNTQIGLLDHQKLVVVEV